VISVAYPLGDVLLLAMLARLMSAGGSRTRSLQLLTCATLGLLAADVMYGLIQLNGTWAVGRWTVVGSFSTSCWELRPSVPPWVR
jgi:hypothetical protein